MTSAGSGGPVAFLAPRWPPDAGGLARAAARLSRGVAAARPVEVLAPDPALPEGAVVEEPGAPHVVRFGASRQDAVQRGFFELLTTRGPYALVHAVYPSETGFPAAYAARVLGVPCVLAARGNDLDRDPFRGDRLPGLLWALERADAVVGVSRALADRARALGARRAIAIPNGVAAGRFRPLPPDPALAARLGVAGGGPVIAFVGEARPKKGLATMLAAIDMLRATHPGARLWLIGGVRADGRALVDAHGPAGIVETPAVDPDDLPALLALADLCWHPSHADGLPNAVLEALACGRATIGARAGGLPDILEDGELAGLLVPPRDAGALAGLTGALLGDRGRLRRLGVLGRARVEGAFTTEAEVGAYLGLYEDVGAGLPHPALWPPSSP